MLDKVGEELNGLRAFKSEQDVRKNSLPKSEAEYALRNSPDFKLPEGVTFEFKPDDPLVAQARKIAHQRGFDQETFSSLVDMYVSNKISEQTNAARLRAANLEQLGAAGPQRIDAVSTWLSARAGEEGKALGNFLKQYPSAPIVKAMETLIRQFSSSGTAFSPQHRETVDDNTGKIPGYENMSFTQRRVAQMAAQFNKPNGR